MVLNEIHATNFRSLLDVTVAVDAVTILIGPNGCGKSNLLHCLRFFYEQGYAITEACFFNRDKSVPITVTLTFAELTAQEREAFGGYVDGDVLRITREVEWNEGSPRARYFGMRDRCPDFQHIRQLTGKGKKEAYNTLVKAGAFPELERVGTIEEVDPAFEAWEQTHTDRCERMRDDGQFFGWTGVGYGRIDRFSKWLFIPAVRDPGSEGTESKGSALKDLVDIFLRSKLQDHQGIKTLQADTSSKFKDMLKPENISELQTMSDELTARLESFSPGTSVQVGWRSEGSVRLDLPSTGTDISEGRFVGPVEHAGHGTQRAFLIAILQYVVDARISVQAEEGGLPPHILLGIEEPELYLHPTRARLMSRVLQLLSEPDDDRPRIQSIYATHSPLFVELPRFNSVRLGRRVSSADETIPSTTEFSAARLDDVAATLASAFQVDQSDYSADRLLPRLATLMTPYLAEGFFADLVVLVEGEEDRALILAAAKHAGHDFEAQGIAVLPAGGKTNLDRPCVIFKALGIPCFVIFDADESNRSNPRDAHPETNRALLRLAAIAPEEFPETAVHPSLACCKDCLRKTIEDEIGPRFEAILADVARELGYDELKQARKNPTVVSTALDRYNAEGLDSPTLARIVAAIVALRAST